LNVSSPTNSQIKYYQSPTPLNISAPLSPRYFSQNNDESEYSFYNNIQASCNINSFSNSNYLNQENNFQTPVMNFNSNNKNQNNDQNNNDENSNFQKFENNSSDTNTSSKNIQLKTSSFSLNIENIVSTANLCVEINLREIALQSKNAEYNPKRFSAVIMKIREPKTTGLIFSSGRIVCLGAKDEEMSKRACRKFAKIIKSMGYPVVFKEFAIQNIVGSADIKAQISLTRLYIHLMKKTLYKGKSCVAYEPEQFPGLIYRMIDPNIVILIFASGKIVLTGGKKKDDIFEGFKKIYPLLIKFKIENELSNNKELHRESVELMKEIKGKENEIQNN
jgi:transcription initiation factor TFIID TATA-box-binding protein